MPLLGGKVFVLKQDGKSGSSSSRKGGKGSNPEGCEAGTNRRPKFHLALTNESFDTFDDLEARISFYNRQIWTCRCTGHPNLTYPEAQRSEHRVMASLARTFPTVFASAILHFVHLSRSPLPPLIDAVSKMLSENLFVGEPVEFKVKRNSAIVRGTICLHDGTTSSGRDPNLINFHQYPQSPRAKKSDPVSYTVKLDSESKLVSNVPQNDLTRMTHLPSKESIRVFIRCNAIRYGVRPESPWVVDDDPRKKAGICELAYPAEIDFAIRAHTVYSENMRLFSSHRMNNGHSRMPAGQTTLEFAENGLQIVKPLNTANSVNQTKQSTIGSASSRQGCLNSTTPKLGPFTQKLLWNLNGVNIESNQAKLLIARLSRILKPEEMALVPEAIRQRVQDRWDTASEKQKLASMTAQERKSYIAEKIRRRIVALRNESKTIEDTQLCRSYSLPEPSEIECPQGIRGVIGEVLFICEFFNCFDNVMAIDTRTKLTFDLMCEWLSKPNRAELVNTVVITLVRTLLEDKTLQQESVYNVKMTQIPLCPHSIGEFIRHYLVFADETSGFRDTESARLVDALDQNDFCSMDIPDQVQLIVELCHIILNLSLVPEYLNKLNAMVGRIRKKISTLSTNSPCLASEKAKNRNNSEVVRSKDAICNSKEKVKCLSEGTADTRKANECASIASTKSTTDMERDDLIADRASAEQTPTTEIDPAPNGSAERDYSSNARKRTALEAEEDRLQRKLETAAHMCRLKPLGLDVDHNKYWLFQSYRGIIVEKYDTTNQFKATTSWFTYNTEDQFAALMNALMSKGRRESMLLKALRKREREVKESIMSPCSTANGEEDLALSGAGDVGSQCKQNIHNLMKEIANAQLTKSGVNPQLFDKLQKATSISDITSCLLEIQSNIIKRICFGGSNGRKTSIDKDTCPSGMDAEVRWIRDLKQCKTFSRLYFLTEVLTVSLSHVLNKRCKACKRSRGQYPVTICDNCRHVYHLDCVRPKLNAAPIDEWTCSDCSAKESSRSNPRKKPGSERIRCSSRLKIERVDTDCMVCRRTNQSGLCPMVKCRSCHRCIHVDCSWPPIRQVKCQDWACWDCRNVPRPGSVTHTTSRGRKRSCRGSFTEGRSSSHNKRERRQNVRGLEEGSGEGSDHSVQIDVDMDGAPSSDHLENISDEECCLRD